MPRSLAYPLKLYLLLFLVGGSAYVCLELFWRGHSHPSMFMVGGLCFLILEKLSRMQTLSFWLRCAMASAAITVVEFCAGCVVNLWWGMEVWDYSTFPFQLLGQVCLLYSLLWCGLAAIVIKSIEGCRRVYERGARRV